jgi:hypothetical protein
MFIYVRCVADNAKQPLELGIMSFNPHSQSATIYDSGNQPYEATNVAQVSHAVTATLVHANKTANQYVYINSFTLTQNKLLAALERASGTKWDVTHSTAKEFGESSLTKLKESESQSPVRMSPVGDYPDGAPQLITAVIYGYRPDGVVSLNDFEGKAKVWNQKLGLKEEEKIKVAKVGTKE